MKRRREASPPAPVVCSGALLPEVWALVRRYWAALLLRDQWSALLAHLTLRRIYVHGHNDPREIAMAGDHLVECLHSMALTRLHWFGLCIGGLELGRTLQSKGDGGILLHPKHRLVLVDCAALNNDARYQKWCLGQDSAFNMSTRFVSLAPPVK